MKITIDLSENEILSLESCVEVSEMEGYEEGEAREALRKIREAFQQGVYLTDGGHSQSDNESKPATISG